MRDSLNYTSHAKTGAFTWIFPGSDHVAIDGLREQFGNLCNGSAVHHQLPTAGSSPKGGGYRELGRRGNENLEDYLLPVIKLMTHGGKGYREAFKQIAKGLDVTYNTVSAQCTRALRLRTAAFDEHVKSRRIVQVLKDKFPDKHDLIDKELRSWPPLTQFRPFNREAEACPGGGNPD